MTPSIRKMPKLHVAAALGAAAFVALACAGSLEPGDLPPPSFLARPDTVLPGDTFKIVFALRNPTGDTLVIHSAYGCLFFLESFRGDEPVAIQGTTYACTANFRTFKIAPADSLHFVLELVAVLANARPAQLPPGTYRIRTRMNADLADLETRVTVIDSVGAT